MAPWRLRCSAQEGIDPLVQCGEILESCDSARITMLVPLHSVPCSEHIQRLLYLTNPTTCAVIYITRSWTTHGLECVHDSSVRLVMVLMPLVFPAFESTSQGLIWSHLSCTWTSRCSRPCRILHVTSWCQVLKIDLTSFRLSVSRNTSSKRTCCTPGDGSYAMTGAVSGAMSLLGLLVGLAPGAIRLLR